MMNAVLADIKERLPNFMISWSHIFKHAYWSNVVANLKGKNVDIELIVQLQFLF